MYIMTTSTHRSGCSHQLSSVFLVVVIKGYVVVENKKIRIPKKSERKAAQFTNGSGDVAFSLLL